MLGLAGLSSLALAACEQIEQLRDEWRPETPHEAYLKGLHDAGLATTALSQEWVAQAAGALRDPRPVELPYQEEGFIPPEDPTAVGYRFTLRRGQRLTVSLVVNSDEATRVFLELFRIADDPADPPRPLNGVDTTATGLSYEPFRAGEFVVRIQPELLRGGSYQLSLAVDPALAFPVQDLDTRAIGSVFGDPRAGGARAHHGVDIFAPRGTPALAAIAGVVRRANESNLGGKVVWLRDEQYGRSLYYAHLDSQTVRRGERVQIGDTVGFVGNTGNARTTPPHLHFGIYARGEGPIDPFPYLRRPPGTMPALLAERSVLGTRVRSQGDGVRVRSGPDDDTDILIDLPRYAPLRVLGGNRDWLRVRLPDGRDGYVAARLTEPGDVPVATVLATQERPATRSPRPGSPLVEVLPAGTDLEVLGMYPGYLLVRSPSGHDAWVVDAD